MNQICKHCKKDIEYQSGRQFGAHLTNCKENPDKIYRDVKSIKKKEFTFVCKCGKEYSVISTDKSIILGKYKKCCSYRCSNSKIHSSETKRKISDKLLKINKNSRIRTPKVNFICLECNIEFMDYDRRNRKFCSKGCSTRNRNMNGLATTAGKASVSSQQRRSKNEIAFAKLCSGKYDILINEPIFNGCDADIIIPSFKVAILWNGNWHYEKITKDHSVNQVKNRDRIKISEIIKFGYTPYIIEDRGKYNMIKVEEEWITFNNWITLF